MKSTGLYTRRWLRRSRHHVFSLCPVPHLHFNRHNKSCACIWRWIFSPNALSEGGERTNLYVRMVCTAISLYRRVRYSTEPIPHKTADNTLHVISLNFSETAHSWEINNSHVQNRQPVKSVYLNRKHQCQLVCISVQHRKMRTRRQQT